MDVAKKLRSLFCLLALIIVGCAPIQHSQKTQQPIGKELWAGIGDVILHVNKQRDLKNAFGKSDIFGRKTNEGFSELKLVAIKDSGEVIFHRKDVKILSNETTMSRTPVTTSTGSATTNASGSYYGNSNQGTVTANATTSYSSSTVSPSDDYHAVLSPEQMAIRLKPDERVLVMEGYVIKVLEKTAGAIKYQIEKQ